MPELDVLTRGALLERRSARSLPMPAGLALIVGAAFIAFAGFFPRAALGVLSDAPSAYDDLQTRAPYALLAVYGGALCALVAGLGFALYGARNLLRSWRARGQAALHPGEPWLADWPGDRTGSVQEPDTESKAVIVVVMLGVLCTIFTRVSVTVAQMDSPPPLLARLFLYSIVGFWDVMLCRILYDIVATALRRLRTGAARLQFESFPLALGGSLQARVTANALAGRRQVYATLRCLEEHVVSTLTTRGSRVQSVRIFALHSERQCIDERFERGQAIALVFALPAGDFATRLSTEPFRYWELELESPKVDSIRFLVPVY
jgi:hypothetical protein